MIVSFADLGIMLHTSRPTSSSSGHHAPDVPPFYAPHLAPRFEPECKWGANAGLGVARELMESVKAMHPWISYADLYTLAGAVAVEEMGGACGGWAEGGGRGPSRDVGDGGSKGNHYTLACRLRMYCWGQWLSRRWEAGWEGRAEGPGWQ